MKELETILEMHTRLTIIINELIPLGEVIPHNKIVRNILSMLPSSWDNKVNVIIEARNLNTTTFDDLIGYLETYELKLNRDRLDQQATEPHMTKNPVLKTTHK